jgi:ABC-type Fe3+ transport system permease subunit
MREQPTLRIPLGILALLLALAIYVLAVVWASQWIERLPVLAQAVAYLILGIAWLLPLRRFLIWMETGKWKAPSGASDGT